MWVGVLLLFGWNLLVCQYLWVGGQGFWLFWCVWVYVQDVFSGSGSGLCWLVLYSNISFCNIVIGFGGGMKSFLVMWFLVLLWLMYSVDYLWLGFWVVSVIRLIYVGNICLGVSFEQVIDIVCLLNMGVIVLFSCCLLLRLMLMLCVWLWLLWCVSVVVVRLCVWFWIFFVCCMLRCLGGNVL